MDSIRDIPLPGGGSTFFLSFFRIVGRSYHFFRAWIPLKIHFLAIFTNFNQSLGSKFQSLSISCQSAEPNLMGFSQSLPFNLQSLVTKSESLSILDQSLDTNLSIVWGCPHTKRCMWVGKWAGTFRAPHKG